MPTIVYGDFEWDDAKAAANVAKHGVSFEEAATALVDPNAIFVADDATDEARLVAIGMSKQTRILFVVHVVRGERDRIVSARAATSAEELFYEQGS
ncbi:MAG: BrnT family toxin [Myxococcota bacterium]|nr:BrnT family toxin [Myxococcota bacterium]